MSGDEWQRHREPLAQVHAFTKKALVATILIVFLLLHILGAAVLQHASTGDGGSSERNMSLRLSD